MSGDKYHRLGSCVSTFLVLAMIGLTGCPAGRQADPGRTPPPKDKGAATADPSTGVPGTASATDHRSSSGHAPTGEKSGMSVGRREGAPKEELSGSKKAMVESAVGPRYALESRAVAAVGGRETSSPLSLSGTALAENGTRPKAEAAPIGLPPEYRPSATPAPGDKVIRAAPAEPFAGRPSPLRPSAEPLNPIRPQGSRAEAGLPPAGGSRPNPLRPVRGDEPSLQPMTKAASGVAGNILPAMAAAESTAAGAAKEPGLAKETAGGERSAAAAPKPRKGKHSGVPFDPVKENGPIFVGWQKPKMAILVSGRIEGYLEPCGCAGLDRMKGGISRRHFLMQKLRQDGWPLVSVDVGGLAKGFGRQSEMKFHIMVEAYKKMGYDAIGLGTTDLRLQAAELVSVTKGVGQEASPFVSANIGLFSFAARMIEPYRIVQAGGRKIGITHVLGKEYFPSVRNAEIELADPAQKLAEILPTLKQQADYLILLAFAPMKESIELAQRFPDFRIVVTSGGGAEQPAHSTVVPGTQTQLIEVGEKGMDVVVLGLYDDPQTPLRYQRVPLDSRFGNSAEMRALMESYQEQIKMLGFAGLGLRAVPYPQRELMGAFVGSEKCKDCHEPSYAVWKKSGHSKAYTTLEKTEPPRNFDPECISCHVVGWHPQQYFPYEGGFLSKEKTPHLQHVGCEDCHGPGEAHVKAEQGSDLALQKKLHKAVAVSKADAEKNLCRTCHDLDNSPDFEFSTYWPLVEHYEKDQDKK